MRLRRLHRAVQSILSASYPAPSGVLRRPQLPLRKLPPSPIAYPLTLNSPVPRELACLTCCGGYRQGDAMSRNWTIGCDSDIWLLDSAQALSVLIIIFCLVLSATRRFLLSKTNFIVCTTRWKLLAAPRSCVKRTMLSGWRLPCSITATTSAANSTSFMFRSICKVSFFGMRRQ